MPRGRVKRFERSSGFGFIETEQGDLFVHHTALKGREHLLAGQLVEFEVEPGDRGPRAVSVRVIEDVSPKKKNQPDWRGHRGGAPRFEGQEPPRHQSRRPLAPAARDQAEDAAEAEEADSEGDGSSETSLRTGRRDHDPQ
jgi:CspA family cold shock protein